ncbi:hypothetical protein ACFV0T_27530 [Streptomyces sp. NPDC059582]|uniref:hypothetical protein n=1 Tax=Streptomyces sp. NPDC059582 TaxID=3346875 RepID=UPI0036CD9CDE
MAPSVVRGVVEVAGEGESPPEPDPESEPESAPESESESEDVPDPEPEDDPSWPERASPTVVPPPLKPLPDTNSYVVIPAMVTPNTRAAATTGRRQLLTRARWTVPSVNPSAGEDAWPSGGVSVVRDATVAPAARDGTVTSRNCSPVRLKKCWKSVPPQVATTLTTPAPRIVP